MRISDAVVLAAGKGTRLLPLTETVPKPLIKIAGKEIIRNILEGLENAGIKHASIVIDYLADSFYEFVDVFSSYTSMELELVSQDEKKGTASAIYSAKDFVDDAFIVASGDHVLDTLIYKEALSNYNNEEGLVMLKEVEDPKNYGVAILKEGKIVDMEEKPEHPKSNLSNIGIYVFNSSIFEEIEQIKLSKRGEYEITDILIGKNAYITSRYWIDVGYPWHILDACKWLLSTMKDNSSDAIVENSLLNGKVVVGKNVKIINSVIEGPVFIDDNTQIGPFAYIRGCSSIGKNCNIGSGTTIKNSLLGNGVNAKHLTYIGDSVIGNNVNFGSSTQIANLRFDGETVKMSVNGSKKDSGRRKLGAVIGDNVKTGVNSSILPGTVVDSNAIIPPGQVVKKFVKAKDSH